MANKTNCTINGKPYYRITRTISHDINGKPIKKQFYGSCKSEAEEIAAKYINDIKNGLVSDYTDVTLNDLMHSWIFDFLHNSSKIKPSTFQRYEGIYRNYIKESDIAGMKLKTITPIILQKYYNELSKTHSFSQVNFLNSVLKTFFNWCIDSGYALKNPCLKVNIKGNKNAIVMNKKRTVEILTETEIKQIQEYTKKTNPLMYLLITLDLATGLRLGELLALDLAKIDFKKGYLIVDTTVKEVYIYDTEDTKHIETIYQVPKTQNSFRQVPIPNNVVKELEKIKRKNGLLFCDKKGKPLKAKNVAYQWRKILRECNISHKKFHAIRHTYASMLLKNGADIESVAELMGHTAISITQIYLHSTDTQKNDIVNRINYIFN